MLVWDNEAGVGRGKFHLFPNGPVAVGLLRPHTEDGAGGAHAQEAPVTAPADTPRRKAAPTMTATQPRPSGDRAPVDAGPSPLPLMQLSTGFWAFKTLATAHELGVFAHLDEAGPATAAALAERLGLAERPVRMLLTGCAALGLLHPQPGTDGDPEFANSPMASAYLVPAAQYYFGGWVEMLDHRLYPGWGRLQEAVRANAPTTWDPTRQQSLFDSEDPHLLRVFWDAMHSLSSYTARSLATAVDFSPYRRLLDVGGGSGAYAIELCRAYPQLQATVLDLPQVCEGARRRVVEAGFADRITALPGDFHSEDPLPTGHDLALLSMILHDWDEPTGRALLAKCHRALPPGGVLMISELVVDDDRTGPPAAALMSLNMLVETGGGENWTHAQYARRLVDAGFAEPVAYSLDAPGANRVLVAVRR
jgi:3-hydroxy-5-methyl-1-naphthoate 3-O-methyltransferase